jgi:hypothetical protein
MMAKAEGRKPRLKSTLRICAFALALVLCYAYFMSEKPLSKASTSTSETKPRCAWSGETGKKLKALNDLGLSNKGQAVHLYALSEFEPNVRKFVTYYKRFRQLFQGLITVGIIGIFLATLGGMPWLEPYAWLFVGIVLFIFPFANNPNFQGLNLRNSTRLARVVALGCMVMGGFLFF